MFSVSVVEKIKNRSDLIQKERAFIPASELAARGLERLNKLIKMNEQQRKEFLLQESIEEFKRREKALKEQKYNHWQVYELCKCINDIAELEEIDFKGASEVEKAIVVNRLLNKSIPHSSIIQGVKEYHNSGWCKG